MLNLFVLGTYPSITGSDDRHEIIDSPKEIQKLGKSIAALVRKKNLIPHSLGGFKLTGLNYVERFGFCPEARFVAHQSLIANCSASLIGPDLLLTAGHCVEKNKKLNLEEFVAIFDYQLKQHGQEEFIIQEKDVYQLTAAPHFEFDFPGDRDIAVLKLDREVKNRSILKMDKTRVKKGDDLFMIGFPFGLAMKYTDNGTVTQETGMFGKGKNSFTSDLDSFSVNSGSAVFSRDNKIVGVLVRGSGPNYEWDSDRNCHDWGGLVIPGEYFSEINYIDLIKF